MYQPLRHDADEDDRDDELHLWSRQTVFCTVWTMTLIAHQRACKRPCPRTAPVNLHTVLWSMPAMMTDILGLRQPRGEQRKGHRQNPANQALHMPNKSFWSIPAMMPSISGLKTEKETQREVHCHQQYQPCHTTATVLLDHTGHDAELHGPANEEGEHSARYISSSKTSLVNATATVLLVHTRQDAEHFGSGDARKEHNARCIVTSKTSIASRPLSLSTTSAAKKRGGTRRPLLPSLLPLPPPCLGRGDDELTKPGHLRRRPEL